MNEKIFLDTNIVADIIDANRKGHSQAIKLMERLIDEMFEICVSEDMLTTLFYISKDKKRTLEFFSHVVFTDWLVLHFDNDVLKDGVAIALEKSLDLEDVWQCLCAKQEGCGTIITNDLDFCDCGSIEVVTVEKYLLT